MKFISLPSLRSNESLQQYEYSQTNERKGFTMDSNVNDLNNYMYVAKHNTSFF